MVAISAMVSSLEIEGNEGREMQNAEQKQIDRKVCFGLTRKKWSYIDEREKKELLE
jgi:hypothetical protein